MTVWVDADSCPIQVRKILIKAAIKRRIPVFFVADRRIPLPASPFVSLRLVETGSDRADAEIIKEARAGDLVITRDIPFAAHLVRSEICAIDDRGFVFSKDNIGERLSMRDLMYELRESGVQAERTRPPGPRELKAFADAFDREVTRLRKLRTCGGRSSV